MSASCSQAAGGAKLHIRHLGLCEYEPVWRDMQAFTQQRTVQAADELWLLQHQSVYTLGMNGKREHLLMPGDIPVVEIDRGGQVTYHGPGQMVAYTLFDLKRLNIGIRALVEALESSVIDWLGAQGVVAAARRDAPGVYVEGAKVAALGLRVKRGCSYHGLALNVDTDLEPFAGINPCGYEGMAVTRTRDLGIEQGVEEVAAQWLPYLVERLGYQLT
ncbi:MAG: lipoyl(octanoyl) transferase LipB, partial [Gammaproteobacteria bacterium]|nr:lipoyl(octanoyl) transferase LipB [Gammaproteobacteria bacterium]